MARRAAAASSSTVFIELAVIAAVIFYSSAAVGGTTDPNDVQGLQVLYTSLNSPSQLTGWKATGGDPCGESWKGITCQGSSVVSIQISGLGLSGTMGYLLNNLMSLKTLDLSNNNIHDSIPYQLPPNLTSLNLAANNLSGNIPYSISLTGSLNYVNISRNLLSQAVGDMFANHSALATLDISYNNFTGDLPPSFASLANLSTLQVQSNQLTGSLNMLVSLPLTNLNVANNHFSGWIPKELIYIPNFVYDGNSFANGDAPPSPLYTSPPPGISRNNSRRAPPAGHIPESNIPSKSHDESKNGSKAGPIVVIVLGSLFAVVLFLLALVFCLRRGNKKEIAARPSTGSLPVSGHKENMEMQEQRSKPTSTVSDLKTS